MRIDSIILREIRMPLVRPFETSFGVTRDRRIVLAEVQCEGLSGWGECTAGEHPYFSEESTDTAWEMLLNELGPVMVADHPEHGGDCPRIFRQVRGNRMAKATLENAIWDLEAQREGIMALTVEQLGAQANALRNHFCLSEKVKVSTYSIREFI